MANFKPLKKYLLILIDQFSELEKFTSPFLDVGCGIGDISLHYAQKGFSGLAIDLDEQTVKIAKKNLENYPQITVEQKNVFDLMGKFKTIFVCDVLEHIEDDKSEIKLAANLLSKEGRLVVLAPAFQFLFSEWDRALGHYRRYNAEMLKSLTPHNLVFEKCRYIDSIGFLASLINRIILKQKNISNSQIELWDRIMVPLSRVTDILFHQYFGKSVLAVWKAE